MRSTSIAAISTLLVLALVGCAGTSGAPGSDGQPKRKITALVFTYGDMTLDTAAGTLTSRPRNGAPQTVALRLTPDEMARINAKMDEMGFFAYPDSFIATMPAGQGGELSPAVMYRYEVATTAGNKTLSWTDSVPSEEHKAVQLRELASLIEGIIQAKPEYKTLPAASGYL